MSEPGTDWRAEQRRQRVQAQFYAMAEHEGARWTVAVMRWHAVESIDDMPTSTMRALLAGTHPIYAAGAVRYNPG